MRLRYFVFVLLLLVVALSACLQNKEVVAGTYVAMGGESEVTLVLKDNGKGTWSTDLDDIQFKWSVRKGGKLWLHTVEGGVVQGQVAGNKIFLTLPGVDELVFMRE